MKYMGSKKYLLTNGLGKLIVEKSKNSNRFIDMFTGSGSVAWFAASKIHNKIIAGDIQEYAVILSEAVISRTKKFDFDILKIKWLDKSRKEFVELTKNNSKIKLVPNIVRSAYGGYYFSPQQALIFDILLKNLPKAFPSKSIAKASLITAASQCVASPGHTAQPFKPTNGAIKFIMESWHRDPFLYAEKAAKNISSQFTKKKGKAILIDANELVKTVQEQDLVFLDPPYSGVHYSRFYHVLETIARGRKVKVSGEGRYPPTEERPTSKYSMSSFSKSTLDDLLKNLSIKKANVILTFPKGKASNGLSGRMVRTIAKKYFTIKQEEIKNRFSTLGGNSFTRPARKSVNELVLYLEPKF